MHIFLIGLSDAFARSVARYVSADAEPSPPWRQRLEANR